MHQLFVFVFVFVQHLYVFVFVQNEQAKQKQTKQKQQDKRHLSPVFDAASSVAPLTAVPEDALRRSSVVVLLLEEVDENRDVQRLAHKFVVV